MYKDNIFDKYHSTSLRPSMVDVKESQWCLWFRDVATSLIRSYMRMRAVMKSSIITQILWLSRSNEIESYYTHHRAAMIPSRGEWFVLQSSYPSRYNECEVYLFMITPYDNISNLGFLDHQYSYQTKCVQRTKVFSPFQ